MTPDGTVTEYAYNSDGSITKVTATKTSGESEELRYLYNLDGTLAASISSSDILEYAYNSRGAVTSVTKNNTHQVKLSYDGNGNMTRLEELTDGIIESVTGYSYDAKGQLTKVSNAEGILASYISRADGMLEQVTDGSGNVTRYQYNQQKQVTGLTITAADGSVLYSEANTYNRNGSLLAQSIGGTGYEAESRSYSYDALDRLLSESSNGVTTSYTYDSMGNRLTKTQDGVTTAYAYDLCNKLLTETTGEEEVTYSYDALGNLTAKASSAGVTVYAYNALNQLAEVTNPDGTWQRNTYDASGLRSMITENGITTEFMTLNGMVVSGYDKVGQRIEHYYYGNSQLAAEYAGAETSLYYNLKNSHGDVIGLTDTYRTLTETYRYDAFGTLTSIQSLNENDVLAETETTLSRFLYAGEQYDNVTGLYYLRARQYDAVLGRFTQEDTYLGDGRNLFAYVSSNPLKYVDPSGHDKEMGYGIFEKNTYRDMLITDFALGQQEKAKENLIWEGVAEVAKGGLQTASGGLVFGAGVVVMPIHPVIGVSGATVGSGYANMGISNMSEGVQKIYNGFTGNVDVPTFNPTRDTFFGGSQTNYNYAQAILGGTNFIYGVGLPNLPTGLPSTGSIMEYANAGSQMLDFADLLEENSGSSYSNNVATVDELIEMMNQREGVTARFATGDELEYLLSQGAEASHMLLEDGTSDMIFRKDVSTRWTMYHEWLHHYLQKKNGGYMPGEDEFIEDFLEKHKELFKIGH